MKDIMQTSKLIREGFLVHAEITDAGVRRRSSTLCTSSVHGNNIMADLLVRLDPFVYAANGEARRSARA